MSKSSSGADGCGGRTRCLPDSHRSPDQYAKRSPMLTVSASGSNGASAQPASMSAWPVIVRPPTRIPLLDLAAFPCPRNIRWPPLPGPANPGRRPWSNTSLGLGRQRKEATRRSAQLGDQVGPPVVKIDGRDRVRVHGDPAQCGIGHHPADARKVTCGRGWRLVDCP